HAALSTRSLHDALPIYGLVWRDPGTCSNPPPWAPAHGWRARCGSGGTVIVVPGGSVPSNCKLTGFGNGNIRCKGGSGRGSGRGRSEEHTSELQSRENLV